MGLSISASRLIKKKSHNQENLALGFIFLSKGTSNVSGNNRLIMDVGTQRY